MPVIMGSVEMDDLAKKLARMRYRRAIGYTRSLDLKRRLDIFRVAVGQNEWHTRFTLPTKGLRITLVERHQEYGEPNSLGYRKSRFKYIEARVEGIPDPVRERMLEKGVNIAEA